MEQALNVKDFVIDIPQAIKEIQNKKTKAKELNEHQFTVILENNTDFVLNRITATTDKNLVFLVSQGIFYIKNNKNEEVEVLTEAKLRAFFQQIYYDKFTQFNKVVWWNNDRPENKIETMMKIINNPDIQELYKHNIFVNDNYSVEKYMLLFKQNKKLFQYAYENIKNNSNFIYLIGLLLEINNSFDFNNAKYFIDKLAESSVKVDIYYNGGYGENYYKMFINLINKYNLNFNRFIDYILNDLYSQGIDNLKNDLLSLYSDYLNMQVGLYGKVKEKYPKYLRTEHDIMTLKYNIYQKYKKDLLIFNVADRYKDLEYQTKQYTIILPKTSMDIVDEGVNQSHCVASYVDKVAKNETLILFMRNTEDIEKSLITIEVKDDTVTQIRGFANRLPYENEENFLKKWAENKKLNYLPDKAILNNNINN